MEQEGTKLQIGEQAPDFTLKAQDGKKVTLSDYRGKKNVMLVFYPQDFTAVCSHQIPSYSEKLNKFDALDTQVLAIGIASIPVHVAWIEHLGGIDYPLLADWAPYAEVTKKYGVFIPQLGFAKRAIFIVDKKGIIRYIDVTPELGVTPDEKKIFEALEALKGSKDH
ncbi:MAG: peroxiredoxin [Candidatus Thorarchaeota archaeon]